MVPFQIFRKSSKSLPWILTRFMSISTEMAYMQYHVEKSSLDALNFQYLMHTDCS